MKLQLRMSSVNATRFQRKNPSARAVRATTLWVVHQRLTLHNKLKQTTADTNMYVGTNARVSRNFKIYSPDKSLHHPTVCERTVCAYQQQPAVVIEVIEGNQTWVRYSQQG
jgi:hypothetical protein